MSTTPEQRIAERMKEARRAAGISQEEAGRRLGVTLRTYARWERVETLGFVGHISEIAAALETTPEVLLGGERQLVGTTADGLSRKLDIVMGELQELRKQMGE